MDANEPTPPTPTPAAGPLRVWSFERLFGGWRVSKSRPCPFCGGDSNCQVSAEGAIVCRRHETTETGWKRGGLREVRGVTYVAQKANTRRIWVPCDSEGTPAAMTELTAEEKNRRDALVAAVDDAKRELAYRAYVEACGGNMASTRGIDSMPIREYLLSRGINPAHLPGGKVPASLRACPKAPRFYDFEAGGGKGWANPLTDASDHPRTLDQVRLLSWTRGKKNGTGAMLAPVWSTDRSLPLAARWRGMHATYLKRLPSGKIVKDATSTTADGGRRFHGSCDGVVFLPGAGSTREQPYPQGVLGVGEGVETCLSVQAGFGAAGVMGITCWAALNADGLKRVVLPPREAGIHTILVFIDLDKLVTSDGYISRTGQRKGMAAVELYRAQCPWATVIPVWLRAQYFPGLVRSVRLEGDDLSRAEAGELGCAVSRNQLGELVEDQPIAGGVDMNDGLVAVGGSDGDAAAFVCGIMHGVDFTVNRDAMIAWDRKARPWSVEGGLDEVKARLDADPPPPGEDQKRAGAGARGGERRRSTKGSGGSGRGGDGGGGGHDGTEHDHSQDDGDDDGGAADWTTESGWVVPVHLRLEQGELERSRRFLLECWSGSQDTRAGKCLGLVHVDGDFRRYDAESGVWQPMAAKSEIGALRDQVRRWLAPKYERAYVREEWTVRKVNHSLRQVEAIAKCVLDECKIDTTDLRFWITPHFDHAGEPIWGRPAWKKVERDPASKGLPAVDDLIVFQNIILDAKAWKDGEFRTLEHTPLLFNQQALPFSLPVKRMRDAEAAAAKGDPAAWERLAGELAPTFIGKFLPSAFMADLDATGAIEQIETAQMLLGYWLTYSIKYKNAGLAVAHGPNDAGKGTFMDVCKAVIGRGNYIATSIDELSDKNHLSAFLGKRLALISEGESGDFADVKRSLRIVKAITGGDEVALREIYKLERPSELLLTRFFLTCNEMPDWKDASGALSARMIVLDFKVSSHATGSYDPGLKPKILSEVLGVMLWGLLGLREIGRRERAGEPVFTQPESGSSPLVAFNAATSDYLDFVDGWIEVTSNLHDLLPTQRMFDAYCLYLTERGKTPPKGSGVPAFSKKIQTPLRKAGWVLALKPEATIKKLGGPVRRMAAYEGLRLSVHAEAALAAEAAKGSYGGGQQAFSS